MKKILFLLLSFISIASYAQETDAALKTQFDIIRNEPAAGGNTKARIADAFQALADSKVNRSEVVIASGTNNYAITVNSTIVDLSHNPAFKVKFVNGNTSAVTLTATPAGGSSLGTIAVKKNVSTALVSGDIPAGSIFDVVYDGTNFQINIPTSGGGGSSVWGSITGTLSDQTDLQSALNGKQASGSYFTVGNNLSEGTASTMRTNLGLGTLATQNGTAPGSTIAGINDTQTFTNKTLTSPIINFGSDANGDILIRSSGTYTRLPIGSSTQVLTVNGGLPSWQNASTGFTNPMAALGDIIYEDATPTATRLPGNTTTTKKFLSQTGNGTISAIPSWSTVAGTDLTGSSLPSGITASSLTSLGTIGTGVWNGTAVDVAHGGTNLTSTTAYGLLAGGTTSTGAFQNIGTGVLGQVPVSQGVGAVPVWGPVVTTQNAVVIQGSVLNIFGDSYSQSTQASPSTAGFVPITGNALGVTLNNQSVSGQGVFTAAKNALANVSINNTNPTIITVGFNDGRRNGSAAATLLKAKAGIRSVIANSMLASAVAANDASVTAVGSWTTTSGIGDKASGNLSGLVRKSAASGNTLTWTFTGSTMVIGSFNTDQVTTISGDWTYAIDGGSAVTFSGKNGTDGITDGTNNNSVIPNCVVVNGLGSGSHTVVVTASETNPATIDYFGTLRPIINCAPVLVNSLPYMNTTGYAISPAFGSTVAFQAITAAEFAVVDEFTLMGYAVYKNELNDFFSISTGVGADNIHPNNLGYQQIFNSIIKTFKPGNIVPPNPIVLKDGAGNGSTFNNNADVTWISANVNQATGIFSNTSKAAAQIALTGTTSDGSITFYTIGTNNSSPTQAMKIQKNHDVILETGMDIKGAASTTNNGVVLRLNTTGGTTGLITALNTTTATFVPLQVQGSTILVQSGSFFSFNTNALGNTQIGSNGTASAKLHVLPNVLTSAHLPSFQADAAAHTGMATATEFKNFIFGGATQTAASGTTATQRHFYIARNTYAGTSGTRTVTNPYGLYVEDAAAGTNGALTNNYAIGADGNIVMVTAGNKFYIKEGTNGSLGQTTLVSGTKAITVTGTTTSTRCFLTLDSQGGTVTTTIGYTCHCTANTVTITAVDATKATVTTDTSVLTYHLIEPTP